MATDKHWERKAVSQGSPYLFIHSSENLSEVKVKVQGKNRRTENFLLVIARPRFKISLSNMAMKDFGLKYDGRQNSRWHPGGGLHSVDAL